MKRSCPCMPTIENMQHLVHSYKFDSPRLANGTEKNRRVRPVRNDSFLMKPCWGWKELLGACDATIQVCLLWRLKPFNSKYSVDTLPQSTHKPQHSGVIIQHECPRIRSRPHPHNNGRSILALRLPYTGTSSRKGWASCCKHGKTLPAMRPTDAIPTVPYY